MEEKKKIKVSLSAIVIFILLAIIIGMGFYIYKLNKDKYYMTVGASQQIEELNGKIDDLEDKIKKDENKENAENIELNSEQKEKYETLELEKETLADFERNARETYLDYFYMDEEKIIKEYFINETVANEPSYKDECSVTLFENNLCSIYEGYGFCKSGSYYIKDNQLICNTIISLGQEGAFIIGFTNIVFEFDIIDNNTIKLKDIKNYDVDAESINSNLSKYGLMIYDNSGYVLGNTYSVK